ncbi:MAG: hypothetical protein Q8K18_15635 [Burkholderiales bacterium]|nr:hypothetical protein [Burkholderiales bacterium]
MMARMRVSARLSLLLGVMALVAACAGPQPSSSPARQVNLSGYSAAFKQGYADGCDSTGRRDEQRYEKDADYMMGWNDGNSICSKRK